MHTNTCNIVLRRNFVNVDVSLETFKQPLGSLIVKKVQLLRIAEKTVERNTS